MSDVVLQDELVNYLLLFKIKVQKQMKKKQIIKPVGGTGSFLADSFFAQSSVNTFSVNVNGR